MLKILRKNRKLSAEKETWKGLTGHRLYAIGDVHGCHDLLEELVSKIQADHSERAPKPTVLVFLGDIIDRGPDSRGTIEFALNLGKADAPCEFLMGNHESMMLQVLFGEDTKLVKSWLRYGGEECLKSYGVDTAELWNQDSLSIKEMMKNIIPESHIQFLQSFKSYYEFGDYLLVHAGIDPKKALSEQKDKDYLWSREPFLSWSGQLEKKIVHGHTICEEPEFCPHRIGIDSGAYLTGRLSGLRIEEGETSVLQVQR